MVKLKIAIIGFGNFRQFQASKFIKYHDIIAYSITSYLELCNKMNINFFTNLNDLLNQDPDIIIIQVSISSFEKIITELSKYIEKLENKLIVDVLSVKEYPKKILLATHPMFEPDSGNTVNQWTDLTFVYDPCKFIIPKDQIFF